MDSTLVAAIIGVVGTLLGVALTRLFDLIERRSAYQQRLDELRLPKRLDMFSTLHAATIRLTALAGKLDRHGFRGITQEDIDAIHSAFLEFKITAELALIYLPGGSEGHLLIFKYHMALAGVEIMALQDLTERKTNPAHNSEIMEEKYYTFLNDLESTQEQLTRYLQQDLAPTTITHFKSMKTSVPPES